MQPILDFIKHKLDIQSPTPLYLQLKQALKAAIDEKLLTHGSILPSERKMSQGLHLSRVTVVKALNELLESGWIIKRQGRGTEVNLPVSYKLANGGFSSQLQHLGKVSNRWLVRELITADTHLAQELEIELGMKVAKIKRVRLVDDLPVSLETMFIPEAFLPSPELLEESLYSWWAERGIYPDEQNYSLAVYLPSKEESRLLSLHETTPLMKLLLKSRDSKGTVIEYGTAYCLNNYFNFEFNVKYRTA